MTTHTHQIPEQGLYNPTYERDACGVGLLLNIQGKKSHKIVDDGLKVLENMIHRGAEGADSATGDGAGIMIQIPHEFILAQGIPVPENGSYGTGLVFMPKDEKRIATILKTIKQSAAEEGLSLLAVRDVSVDNSMLGVGALEAEPAIKQIFLTKNGESKIENNAQLEIRLYRTRRRIEKAYTDTYIVSLSSKNMIYKGMLSSAQLRHYFLDLQDQNLTSGISLVHSRFSTNTFPSWALAQPFRLLGHNGEINTIRGNRLWTVARESVLQSPALGDESVVNPVVQPAMSDSASLDNMLEFFIMAGMSLPHALAMLVPQSFNDKNPISQELKAFYEYHSILMDPWDGPATLLFSDGRYAGGMLDRNGLRPARYTLTKDGMLVIASEAGVLPIDAKDVVEKGRLQPGKILLVDTETGTIYRDNEVKETLANQFPYGEWLRKNRVHLGEITSGRKVSPDVKNYEQLKKVFGYFDEEIQRIIMPMADAGAEPTASMGNDTPIALFSEKPQLLFNYFRQQFAQVTNPPIDPIREELVMSLEGYIGALDKNLLSPSEEHCKQIHIKQPILTNRDMDILRHIDYKGFRTKTLAMTFPIAEGAKGMAKAVERLCQEAEQAVEEQFNYIILSDKNVNEKNAPIPSVLVVSAVHHHLVEKRKRTKTALIVETGEAREVMHFALLLGYGASAINPYMAYSVISQLIKEKTLSLDYSTAEQHFIKAVGKGLLKVISKMGISTIGSYRGAQLFESLGLSQNVIDTYFTDTTSSVGGADLDDITTDVLRFHAAAFGNKNLGDLGQYAFRKEGEKHAWNPETIATLQLATRLGSYEKFKEYSSVVNNKTYPIFLRDRLDYKRNPIDISQVEPVEAIMRRFVTGAMSFGSISKEAHEAMAEAMNRIGGKSNTGEGGEDPARFATPARSAIKQVASGRFGVTANYLINADEIQIKVAQGAKPGEGGQLPGFKVDEVIAKTRHSIPGISLISPPPHHDIYSIEDLAQLIFDLKNVNPQAKISVKLVAESGIGTIAAGVAKAKADGIIISGSEGGTGASPMSSIRHTGVSSEIGLAEVQQTLVLNGLRSRVALQVDGQIKTGRDIVIQALLGAEEFGFATSALIVLGCVMMRKCHLNTCPVGVATQNAELRKRFKGDADYLVNFFTFLAEEVREILAEMGFTKLDDVVGRTDLIVEKPKTGVSKIDKADFSKILFGKNYVGNNPLRKEINQEKNPETVILKSLIDAYESGKKSIELPINNTDRTVGATLAGKIALKYGDEGLPEDSFSATFKGSSGQSFGAFLVKGMTFVLRGEANDYLGKGLSGGKIVLVPAKGATYASERNVIAGNTLMYGATSGEVYINGRVGERFCVRNSGAIAVVEGTGEHCCEYMTGGRVVVLGYTGRNFGAGMSGGVAYVWNADGGFDARCNMEMVELSLVDNKADSQELLALIENHYRYTQSAAAKRIIENPDLLGQFIKVTPIEYKKVLQEEQLRMLQQKISEVQRD
ncbi:MAG: glutamate synthase large subunit [Bacteroidales bacterium]|jgi:glutamate synthase (NADPH/NADH) large chain|nr:glutamate synthase large subunit [Bacteroidales bacterium]